MRGLPWLPGVEVTLVTLGWGYPGYPGVGYPGLRLPWLPGVGVTRG